MENLIYEKLEAIALVKINRPKAYNALNRKTLEELLEFLTVVAPRESIRAIVLTGVGDKAFIAGADIKEMQSMDPLQVLQFLQLGQQVANALENGSFLTIAAVNGYALGGGLEMALACDFIYASKNARLGLPEVTLGIIPGFGGTQRLARAIGTRQAKELIMSGRTLLAEEALQLGIVNRLCEDANLQSECLAVAESITKHSFIATAQAKHAINTGCGMNLPAALELERNMFAVCFATPERQEAMSTFLNRK